jgi:tubulin polyglutamylase TTLL6/13
MGDWMFRLFPLHYKFFPRAFVLPDQLSDLLACFSTSKVRTYILKPDMGSQVWFGLSLLCRD